MAAMIHHDIRAGMNHEMLMHKYQLSESELKSILSELGETFEPQKRGDESASRPSATVWKCPACGKEQKQKYEECPTCGIVVAKFGVRPAANAIEAEHSKTVEDAQNRVQGVHQRVAAVWEHVCGLARAGSYKELLRTYRFLLAGIVAFVVAAAILGTLSRGGGVSNPIIAPPPSPSLPIAQPAPPAAKRKPNQENVLTVETLEKPGDKGFIQLPEKPVVYPIHIRLKWEWRGQRPDLDLGCMYRMKDGLKSVIQAVNNNYGSKESAPFICLDKDDRSGLSLEGENLYIYRPDLIDLVMVFCFIYEGATDFVAVNTLVTIQDQQGNMIKLRLSDPAVHRRFSAVCTVRNIGDRIEVTKEERYFIAHPFADQHYGFGFQWGRAEKDPY